MVSAMGGQFMKRRTLCVAVVIAALAIWVVGLGCWPVLVWSRLNCSCEDIDINSGRIRHRRYLLGICVYTTVEETSLSRVASAGGAVESANWRCVNTFSPLVHHSPHYRYHNAICHANLLCPFREPQVGGKTKGRSGEEPCGSGDQWGIGSAASSAFQTSGRNCVSVSAGVWRIFASTLVR